MADLAALIERLEKLTGPDREVDEAIHRIAQPNADMFRRWNPEPIVDYSDVGSHWKWNAEWLSGGFSSVPFPKYTASLDAVIALVERELPGKWPELLREAISVLGKRHRWHIMPPEPGQLAELAPALCLALLRAKGGDNG